MKLDFRHRSRCALVQALIAGTSLALGLAAATPALAQRHEGGPGGQVFDGRYHHDHYYPRRGWAAPGLPRGALSIGWGGGHYFYEGGVWYRPWGRRYVVVLPPIGVIVPVLPPVYASLWIDGAPYYYANGIYYAPVPGQGYSVVAPPPGADSAQVAPPAPDMAITPRNGQSPAQTEADRQDCNRFAVTQPAAMADAQIFQNTVATCLDARGYTAR